MSNDLRAKPAGSPNDCLTRSVLSALAEDPGLEAVTIDRARQTISVATLGKANVEGIEARINNTIANAEDADQDHRCQLLAGAGDCAGCVRPIDEMQRQKITIRHEANTTTIARVTCPTAPKFWRWRDLPFPKIVQRDVEFLEHAGEINEWKPQLLAAVLCGVFGLAGFFLKEQPTALISFLVAYVAGSWFAAIEVWERLQKRAIDVHFLMLAVAFGSASIGAWEEGATLLFLFSLSGALEHFALADLAALREIADLDHGEGFKMHLRKPLLQATQHLAVPVERQFRVQTADGFIPYGVNHSGKNCHEPLATAPFLANESWTAYNWSGDRRFLTDAYEVAGKYVTWWRSPARTHDGISLQHWFNFIENGADPAHFSILHRADPKDGTIVRDESGEPTGVLLEGAVQHATLGQLRVTSRAALRRWSGRRRAGCRTRRSRRPRRAFRGAWIHTMRLRCAVRRWR